MPVQVFFEYICKNGDCNTELSMEQILPGSEHPKETCPACETEMYYLGRTFQALEPLQSHTDAW